MRTRYTLYFAGLLSIVGLSACGTAEDPMAQQRLGQALQVLAQVKLIPGVISARISGPYSEGKLGIPAQTHGCVFSVTVAQSQKQNVQTQITQLQQSTPYQICITSTDVTK